MHPFLPQRIAVDVHQRHAAPDVEEEPVHVGLHPDGAARELLELEAVRLDDRHLVRGEIVIW